MKIKSALVMTMLCVYLTLSLTACNTLEKNLHSSTDIIEQEDNTNGVLSQEDSIKTQIAIFAEETMQAYTATHTATSTFTPSPTATEHPTQTPTESQPLTDLMPQNTATHVPTKPPANEARYKGLSFIIPGGLTYSWTAEEKQQSADPGGPQSKHYLFNLNISQSNQHLRKAQIYVFPLQDYVEKNYWQYHIDELDTYRTTGDFSNLSSYDILPFPRLFNGSQAFRSKMKVIEFQNGSGFRFLTSYDEDYVPMSTNSLIYAFVGVTHDKNYLVAGVIPFTGSPLPQTTDYPNDYDSIILRYDEHIEEGVRLLNVSEDPAFNPSLEWIDSLFRSLNLTKQ